MTDEVRYIKQEFDFLGSLSRNLRDLQGYDTLAYELIQNADDVKDDLGRPAATQLIFDICDDALYVINDGVFRERDFDRMKLLAAEGKRDEEDTTGAFGIGFTVVYQITDTPELFSSGRHWRFVPINYPNNIEEKSDSTQGTVFRLPYATDPHSLTRQRLKQQAFDVSELDSFQQTLSDAVFFAALFLKQLLLIEVRRSGKSVRRIERKVDGHQVALIDNGKETAWFLLHSSFDKAAEELRARFPIIESKRHSRVTLAIPREVLDQGRLFAVLPTNTITGLPFHINADFFPKSDRKHIIFEGDYQSDWNRAAVRSTAEALLTHFDDLKYHFGHQNIWQFIKQLKDAGAKARVGELDSVFLDIWESVKSTIAETEIVYSTNGRWLKPNQVRITQSDEERNAVSIWEAVEIPIAHLDLRSFQPLLQELGVVPLSIEDIVIRLGDAGFNKTNHISAAPNGLRTRDEWHRLWTAIDTILNRLPKQKQPVEADKLRNCAICLDEQEYLWMSKDIYRGDEGTRQIFWWLRWSVETSGQNTIPWTLIQEFTINDALNELELRDDLEAMWKAGQLSLTALFRWFQDRHRDFSKYSHIDMNGRLRKLHIYPVADVLCPLTDSLYIPSDFVDPLGSTSMIDLSALGNRREFLKELGVKELTLQTFIRNEVPRRFAPKLDISWDQFRKLIDLLAARLGEIRDVPSLRETLISLPLIECIDETIRHPQVAYMHPGVHEILGDNAVIAKTPSTGSVRELYIWLGVAEEPRTADVIERIKDITNSKIEFGDGSAQIAVIFKLLASRQLEDDEFRQLQRMAWLPAKRYGVNLPQKWFHPNQLYSVFQDYLFSDSDAYFLAFERALQNETVDFATRLGIRTAPTADLVVQHLLKSIEMKKALNQQVYRFLNDIVRQQPDVLWLSQLQGKRCIWLNGIYVTPKFVFWGEHPFGDLRGRIPREWFQYQHLLTALGVKESPDFQDYCDVLYEIENAYSQQELSDETMQVLNRCFHHLSQQLQDSQVTSSMLFEAFSEHRVIPNWDNWLTRPADVVFDDRKDISGRFDNQIAVNIIPRLEGAWHSMYCAGVRLLSEVVRIHIVECIDPIIDERISTLIQERRALIKRVIDVLAEGSNQFEPQAFFDSLQVKRAKELVVVYEIPSFNNVQSSPEVTFALWKHDEKTLYYTLAENDTTLRNIARELAIALSSTVRTVPAIAAAALNDILSAKTVQEAKKRLDDYGLSPELESPDLGDSGVQYSDDEYYEGEEQSDSELNGDLTASSTNYSSTEQDVERAPSDDRNDMSNTESAYMPDSESTSAIDKSNFVDADQALTSTSDDTSSNTPTTNKHQPQPTATPSKNSRQRENTDNSGTTEQPKHPNNDEKKHRRPSGKLRSYVIEDTDVDAAEADPETETQRNQVDIAGVAHVLNFERGRGRNPEEMPHHNRGFDVRSVDLATGEVRYIEVKSLSGNWETSNPAALSKAQYDTAYELGDGYWLYVVEKALSPEPRLYQIQNPARRVNQYLFDDGWRAAANNDDRGNETP